MKKILGWIPDDEKNDEDIMPSIFTGKEGNLMINGRVYKLAEVWIPGTKEPDEERDGEGKLLSFNPDCGKVNVVEVKFRLEFEPLERQRAKGIYRVCKNCGKKQDSHLLFRFCQTNKTVI